MVLRAVVTAVTIDTIPAPEGALRRRLRTDVDDLARQFAPHAIMTDATSQQLREWRANFARGLRTDGEEGRVNTTFMALLQQILRDPMPLFHCPLGEEAFLGSDGEVYGREPLCVYLRGMPTALRGRSPVRPERTEPFTVEAHPLVAIAVRWLRGFVLEYPVLPAAVRAAYEEMQRTNTLPRIPTRQYVALQMRARRLVEQDKAESASAQQELARFQAEAFQAAVARVDGIFAGILRRRLHADLYDLSGAFAPHTAMKDQLSARLRKWRTDFSERLSSSGEEMVVHTTFMRALQEILRGSMPPHCPLEEQSYIGSDGTVRGHRELCLYLSKMPPEARGRFTVQPHPMVATTVEWIRRYKPNYPELPREMGADYAKLEVSGTLPKIPTPERVAMQERARRLLRGYAAEEEAAAAEVAQFEAETSRKAAAAVDSLFAGVLPAIQATTRQHQARISAIEERERQMLAEIAGERAEAEGRLSTLRGRATQLAVKLEGLEEAVAASRRDAIALEQSIEDTQRAIAERDAERSAGVLRTLAIVAVCIAISIMLPPVGGGAAASAGTAGTATATSAGWAVAPTADGAGFMARYAVPF